MISVIFSTFNEEENVFFQQSLKLLRELNFEVICIDGGSTDRTKELVLSHGFTFATGDTRSRGLRYNQGIALASYPMILFHHPRSNLMREGLMHLLEHSKKDFWGAFTHRFDLPHPLLTFTSWYSNYVRGDLKHIYYLDHCIFSSKSLLSKIGGFPGIEIFEDTEICLKLRAISSPVRFPFYSTTSAVRFRKNGPWKQAMLNQKMKILYHLKRDPNSMYKMYEKNINLNTDFRKDSP